MDGPRDHHTKYDKDKYHMISLTCEILKKMDTNELIYKTEVDPQTQKTTHGYQRERGEG